MGGSDLYASLSGASGAWQQLELISHNLANADTSAYKARKMVFELGGPSEGLYAELYATPTEGGYDMDPGAIKRDDDPNHLALEGQGFFVVELDGELSLTRDGAFGRDMEGHLRTQAGGYLMGDGGRVQIPEGETFSVSTDGRIIGSESGELDTVRIVSGEGAAPTGEGLWKGGAMDPMADTTIVQGALEGSNVNVVEQMVELIEATRFFEAYQKAMQTSDELDSLMNGTGG